jgi:proteasome alpha subunit
MAMEEFEKKYRDDMNLEEAMELALDAVYEATEGKTTVESVEIAVIDSETKKFRKLSDDDLVDHVEELLIRKPKEEEEEE